MTSPYIITDATDHCVFVCAECGRYLPVTEVVTNDETRCTWIFVSCPDHGRLWRKFFWGAKEPPA